jgi:16S rRNA (cytidine1402-2'-O)-methyltransferase
VARAKLTPRSKDPENVSKSGTLFVVATPIGNLGDLTPRARETLASVDLVLAEDTRHTAGLLAASGIERPLASVHEHNEAQQVPQLLERLQRGENLALVSDAGTPLISDPGYRLVCAAAAAQVPIRAVPGACAATAALSVAGLPSDRFAFEGFLPAKSAARRAALDSLREAAHTLIFYEAPHRLRETLDDMIAVLGEAREAVIARELTKTYESVYRGTLAQLSARAATDADMSRGEIVIVVAGAPARSAADTRELDRTLGVLLAQLPVRQAAELAAQLTGAAPNAAYRRALELSAAAKP